MKYIALVFAGFLISGFLFTNVSCKKKNTDCIASITCTDSLNQPLINANVLLYATVKSASNPAVTYTADLKASGTTDNSGNIRFTFQFPAIYDILATTTVNSKTLTATGIIKLEEGKTIEKTVTAK